MTNEEAIKCRISNIVKSIVEKMEQEFEVFYLNTDSITETIYCLALGGKINTVEEMKMAINKLLKTKLIVVE